MIAGGFWSVVFQTKRSKPICFWLDLLPESANSGNYNSNFNSVILGKQIGFLDVFCTDNSLICDW